MGESPAAGFGQSPAECADTNVSVVFTAGENLHDGLGAGKPGSWSDVSVEFRVTDPCAEGATIVVLSGLTTGVPPDIERLDSANLENLQVELFDADGNPRGHATVNLAWAGNGDVAIRIDHQLDNGYFRQERYETATVTGAVVISGTGAWNATFVPENANDVTIGTASEVSL